MGDQTRHLLTRRQTRLLDVGFRHAGRVGQFRVIVIAQDIGERRRGGSMRIDVRVRIDEDQRIQFGEQPLSKFNGHITQILTIGFPREYARLRVA